MQQMLEKTCTNGFIFRDGIQKNITEKRAIEGKSQRGMTVSRAMAE